MKITITGSLGHIGKPLAKNLIENGHKLTIISSNPERKESIAALGAEPVIGNLEDINLLIESFKGADSIFTMVPPNNYFDQDLDLIAYYKRLGEIYAKAILEADIKRVVNLSTIGGHLDKGNGILRGAHNVEQTLNALPSEVSITHMRPTSFYYNLYGYMETIKSDSTIYANYGSRPIPWVSPRDIAKAVAEELTNLDSNSTVRYVVSEELTGDETAQILGNAIGKPKLKWEIVSDQAIANSLKSIGMNPEIAKGLTEMYAALQSGHLAEDYIKNKPQKTGEVKLKDFAEEFAMVYQNNH
ncbi:NmrA family NAD(P)-binding protein [Sinomicrobium sp. M5D2P9]